MTATTDHVIASGWVLLSPDYKSLWHARDETGKLLCCARNPINIHEWRPDPRGRYDVCPVCRKKVDRAEWEQQRAIREKQRQQPPITNAPHPVQTLVTEVADLLNHSDDFIEPQVTNSPDPVVVINTPEPTQEIPVNKPQTQTAQPMLLTMFAKKHKIPPANLASWIRRNKYHLPRLGKGLLVMPDEAPKLLAAWNNRLTPQQSAAQARDARLASKASNYKGRPPGTKNAITSKEVAERLVNIENMIASICTELRIGEPAPAMAAAQDGDA